MASETTHLLFESIGKTGNPPFGTVTDGRFQPPGCPETAAPVVRARLCSSLSVLKRRSDLGRKWNGPRSGEGHAEAGTRLSDNPWGPA